MKIVHIHRPFRQGAYSIENLFHTVAGELHKQEVTIIDYELGSRFRTLSDLYALWNLKADVYHITGDVNYLSILLPWHKIVLTVHDIGHYLFGLIGWRRVVYKWLWLTLPIQIARRVTAVSTTTRNHITDYLGIPSNKITVIENCFDPMYHPNPKVFNEIYPRILQVGTKPYKNVPRLIHALKSTPCKLILIGELSTDIQVALIENTIDYENYVGISQESLLRQYEEADIVSFISIGEGFGVPIIEAQAMARALITANVPPMSEVAGNEACVADPFDIDSIRTAIHKLISDQSYRDQVIAAGLKNVACYSPEIIANRYLEIYRNVNSSIPAL